MTVLGHCLTVHRLVFYFFGITPYPQNRKLKPSWHQIYRLPSVLLVLICITCIIMAVYLMLKSTVEISQIYVYGDIGSILLIIYTGIIFVNNLRSVSSVMFGMNAAQLLLKQCERVEHLFKLHMLAELDFRRLRAQIALKYCIIAGAYIQSFTVYVVMAVLRKSDIKLSALLYFIQAFSVVIHMHTVLYTEMVHFVLQSINSEMDGGKFVHARRLQGLQRIYFEVWRTVKTITAEQGWGVVTAFAVLMIDFISDVYWFFKALRIKADYKEVIRKFVFFFSLCFH